ncbi:MAG: hypothetical protein P8Z80_06320 [Pseudolabrys sp.]|jgi:hypothetical protein
MNFRRAALIAAVGLAAAAGPAWAQQQPGVGQQRQCVQKFMALRNVAQVKGKRLEAMGKRKHKPTAAVACRMLSEFSTAEGKLLKFATENQSWCGIPAQIVTQMKKVHARTTQTRARVCHVAAVERERPRGPTLSDALGATAPSADNVRSGGTFDTLTGSALGQQ